MEFRYPGAAEPVLQGISFTLSPGETTAIVGSTGSGKTTLASLIPRLFDVTSGSVLVDGTDVRELARDDLWSLIGLVPQKSFLFTGTVATNLRFGRPDATDEELWQALEVAQAADFVRELADGLDAPIDQGGANVSGGQRQRLAIARALVRRPSVYLFDDSFSALDFATDARLRAALGRQTADATVLIVAQRVSTIMHADRIVVLDGGRLVGRRASHRAHGDLRDLPRDRAVADLRGGGRMSTTRTGPPAGHGGMGGPGAPRGGPGGGGPMAGLMVVPEKSKDFGGTVRRLGRRLRPERIALVGVLGMAVVSVALAVIGPWLLGNATTLIFSGVVGKQLPAGVTQDQAEAALRASGNTTQADLISGMTVVPGQGVDFSALGQLLLITVAVYVLSSAFLWGQGYVMAGVTQRTVYVLRQDVERKLGRLPLRYFDTHPRGDLLSRVTNDIDNISSTLQQVLTQLVTATLTVVGVLFMMFWISPLLAVISLLVVPLSFALTVLIARRSRTHFVAQWDWTGRLNGHVEEMYTGHDLVQVFGHRTQAVADFDELNEQMYQSSYRAQFVSGIIQPVMAFIGNLNYVAICVVGGLQVASGALPLGDIQAFIQYSRQFTMPITQIASVINLMQSGVASAERVFELLDAEEEEPDPASPVLVPEPSGRIVLTDLAFRYEPDVPLIHDLSLRVEPGDTVAIVGPTGAGKTTLVNLLMRFYEVDSGRIELDGVDTRLMTRDDLRRSFGMVLQDTWLFGGTIRDNIAYGAEGASLDEIHEAARAANVEHFVHTLPDGYDTVLDDDASNLSAGEKQLLTIARAFLADPAILILDEATSSVDTRTEVLIQHALAQLRAGRTSFVIAHRLSTIRDADMILVMDRGQIVEQGTHDELLARGGVYSDLYESQFLAAADDLAGTLAP